MAIRPIRPIRENTTVPRAYVTPADFAGRDDAYLDEVHLPALRAAKSIGLVGSVDGFWDGIGFQPAQIARVYGLARDLRLPVKQPAELASRIGFNPLQSHIFGGIS